MGGVESTKKSHQEEKRDQADYDDYNYHHHHDEDDRQEDLNNAEDHADHTDHTDHADHADHADNCLEDNRPNNNSERDTDVLQSFRETNRMHKPPRVSSLIPSTSAIPSASALHTKHNLNNLKSRRVVEGAAVEEETEEEEEPTTISGAWVTPEELKLRYYKPCTRRALKESKILFRSSLATKDAFPETDIRNQKPNTNIANRILGQVLEAADRDTEGGLKEEGKQHLQHNFTR